MSTRLRVLTVVGARPQFVKAAVVSRALTHYPGAEEIIVHTGQHFDTNMSDVFFSEMGIPAPKYNLQVGGGSHGENTGRMIERLEKILIDEAPQAVLLYGDTDSTLAGAIAASKLVIPIYHVESGLRSHRRGMPEEINRVVTDRLADRLYAPSSTAVENLLAEGVRRDRILNTGDVMYDAVRLFRDVANKQSTITSALEVAPQSYAMLTLHRKENTDSREALSDIFSALEMWGETVVFPIHPRTKRRIAEYQIILPANVIAIDPLGYMDTLALLQSAKVLLTDSGGMQKEAYFLGRPCVTLREETEWVELVDCGANMLAGSSATTILECLSRRAALPDVPMDIYGNGDASDIIAEDLVRSLSGAST